MIGLISDSHDHIGHLHKASAVFREWQAELLVHAGDMISPGAMRLFPEKNLAAVFGNNDGERHGLLQLFHARGWRLQGDFLELTLDGKRMAVYHGTIAAMREALIDSGRYDYVVSGHTHQPERRVIGTTLALNPGTAHGFGGVATVMLLDTHDDSVEIIDLGR
ncbi:MAG: metallophosphoesterase [Magnetococcales bacterium]|nr:metallophosphoesterase [Magnetococcales bacterium]